MKTITSAKLIRQKNKLAVTKPWTYLFIIQITATEALYLTTHSEPVVFSGHTYNPFPVSIGESVEDSQGNLENVTLSISNVNRMAMAYLELNNALLGNEVIIKLVSLVDLSEAIDLGVYTIMEASADAVSATLVLGHYDFFNITVPRNRYNQRRCRWVFKSAECGYEGGHATCNKTLGGNNADNPGCTYHANTERFGGFPGIPTDRLVIR